MQSVGWPGVLQALAPLDGSLVLPSVSESTPPGGPAAGPQPSQNLFGSLATASCLMKPVGPGGALIGAQNDPWVPVPEAEMQVGKFPMTPPG